MNSTNSQLRQDPVSGDWVIIAPGRSKRPHDNGGKKSKRFILPVKSCPFENPIKSGHKLFLIYGTQEDWSLQVVENKFPVLTHAKICSMPIRRGLFNIARSNGYHEILITRDHKRGFPDLSPQKAFEVLEAFRDRYLALSNDQCVSYVSMIHNWGSLAGASVQHPHYQLVALPIIPQDVQHSLAGSFNYFKKNKKCVHCAMIAWERARKKRIIIENDGAVAFAPFVSRAAYEVRIFPKKHLPYFENTADAEMRSMAEVLQKVLYRFKASLDDPDYNFFIHTSPIADKNKYTNYHWHIEIIPRFSTRASFELGTGININDVDPDVAAKNLSH